MLKKVLIGLVVLVAFFAIFVSTRPSAFRVERSVTMAAPAEAVFPLVNDFHNWNRWSPWSKLDPNQKTTHEGAAMGPGAVYSWSGNDQVGEGRMTLTDSRLNDYVGIKLEFLKPWAATNNVDFSIEPVGTDVKVTWGMTGHNGFMGKAFSLVMNMDKMVGKDFEQGLQSMKDAAEADAKKLAEAKAAAAARAAAEAEAAAAAATAEAVQADTVEAQQKAPARK